MEPIVGIDLGTTNSEVAFIIDKKAEVLKDNDNGILPSCVGLNNEGKVIVGAEAKNQAVIEPERTVLSVKRLMGTDTRIPMGEATYLPQEISAFILKSLKERAEKSLGKPVSKAIITVPAYFTDAQRHATREAGQIAGLEVVRIINEPTAAALAYESTSSKSQRILIYDLGGGTFDVSIVRIQDGVVEVLSSTGDNHLGGDDFDQKIMNLLAEHCEKELKLSVKDKLPSMARLRRAAENAKIALSSAPYTKIIEDNIGKRAWRSVHLSYELSRTEFEEMIEDDLSRTMDSVNKALKDASLLPSAVDKIILVGGSTRIPGISKMLEEKFGKQPHGEIDPDLCVALGAAIQAGREMGFDSTSILLDITPYTFGTSAIGEIKGIPSMSMFVPIIRRNTKLPTSRSEAFYTMYDNQEAVEIKVYQGEEPDALDNIEIGKYIFNLTKSPAGSVIVLNYELDINGILKMEAVEKTTGRKINAVIENAFAQFTDSEIANSRKRIEKLWGGKIQAADEMNENRTGEDMPSDLAETLRRAKEKLDTCSNEDRDEIVNLMEDIMDAVKAGDLYKAGKMKKELDDILFYIG